MVDHRGWPYAGDRKCEWCGEPATRATHDACFFCERCAFPGDMVLTQRPARLVPERHVSTGNGAEG